MDITFTLCFVRFQEQFLMLYRNHPPNQYRWNGVGGKIEKDEDPLHACQREIWEETGLHIELSKISFRGIVTWNQSGGMYVYLAESESKEVTSGEEGKLEWKSWPWILESGEAVSNIPLFLPYMLENRSLAEHAFTYDEQEMIIDYSILPIKPEYVKGKVIEHHEGVKQN